MHSRPRQAASRHVDRALGLQRQTQPSSIFPGQCRAAGEDEREVGVSPVCYLSPPRPINRLQTEEKGTGVVLPHKKCQRHFVQKLFVTYHGAIPTYNAEEHIYIFQLNCWLKALHKVMIPRQPGKGGGDVLGKRLCLSAQQNSSKYANPSRKSPCHPAFLELSNQPCEGLQSKQPFSG